MQIPKIRQGSYFPSFLAPRKRSEQALVSVVQQAYVCGVSTRRVDQLVESLGLRISKSEVSRIAGMLDEQVQAFRERPLEGRYPYLFVDAKIEKVRDGGRVQRKCVVIAHAVHETGRREIIGLDVGATETEAFWREFLRSLLARGLSGVQLAISDAHPGLKAALAQVLGVPWQRCTVHFLRDLRGHAHKDQHDALGALIRQIFTASSSEEARLRLSEATSQLERRLPKIAAMIEEAEEDILAFYEFPQEHWPKLRSTNPLERFNREIGRRTDVVGIFPDDASLIRLVSMLAIEANDEWLVGRSYVSQHSMATLYEPARELVERTTRFVILLTFPAGIPTAETVHQAITAALARLPQALRRTLTWDQGKELALHQKITAETGTGVFFCDAHSPWQRGSNENMNGLLRDYFPKGTDLSVHSVEDVMRIATEVNERPRKTLGWQRPIALFNSQISVACA